MHFFEKQKVDAIGYMGVSLQKSVLFLIIVTMVGSAATGSLLSGLLGSAFLFIAFWGAYKRRTCLLAIYFWVNVICAILGLIAAIALIMVVPAYTYDDNSSSGTMSAEASPHVMSHISRMASVFGGYHPSPPSNSTAGPIIPPTNNNTTTNTNTNTTIISDNSFEGSWESNSSVNIGALVAISFVAVVVSVLVLFFKIYSVILAWKLRKLILASRRCSSAPVCDSTPKDTEPLINPGYPASNDVHLSMLPEQNVVPQQQPMMYMPYPYFNQQNSPYPMMYNQNGQPIFYSFQPMAPQQAQL
jgi:hypothetical protein